MARLIDADALQELCNRRIQDTWNSRAAPPSWAAAYANFKDDIDSMSTLTPPNKWVSVEERLPENEARQYIEDNLDGIGYLYPCLLTYKSPNTERIHVVKFYYDIIKKGFVNNGEELCEKGRCIAWIPLPAPYDHRPPEGEEDI